MNRVVLNILVGIVTLTQLVGCTQAMDIKRSDQVVQSSVEKIMIDSTVQETQEKIGVEPLKPVSEVSKVNWVEKKQPKVLVVEQPKPIKGNTNKVHNILYPELFPELINKATINQQAGNLAKGTVVDVLKDDGKGNYTIKELNKEATYTVKSWQLTFGSKPVLLKNEITTLEIEDHINATQLDSDTNWLVWTSLIRQETYVFKKNKDVWKLEKRLLSSSGAPRTPSPKGFYKLTMKVPSFGQNKGYMCKTAFGFIGTNYLYHSLVFDITGSYLLGGKGVLGTMVSNGCIRFSPEEAKWFYDNLEPNTTVWIN